MSNSENSRKRPRGERARGFTVLELMIAAALALVIGAAVAGTFIFLARSSFRLGQYGDMEGQARRALHQFSEDARQANATTWANANTLTLTVDGTPVTYAYDAATGIFSRAEGAQAPVMVASGITQFAFRAYQATGTEVAPLATSLATANTAAKMIQIELELARSRTSAGTATGQVISARSVLRNKKIN